MKRRYIVVSSFFVAMLLVVLMCYGSHLFASKVDDREKRVTQETGTEKEQKTTSDTVYVVEKYNEDSESVVKEIRTLPVEYAGLTRQELEQFLKKEQIDMSDEDYEEGLTSITLISFSKEEIVIRKTYAKPIKEEGFVLKTYEGEVSVFDNRGKVLYEKTGIPIQVLPEEEQKKLEEGYFVPDEKVLYSILENFSS